MYGVLALPHATLPKAQHSTARYLAYLRYYYCWHAYYRYGTLYRGYLRLVQCSSPYSTDGVDPLSPPSSSSRHSLPTLPTLPHLTSPRLAIHSFLPSVSLTTFTLFYPPSDLFSSLTKSFDFSVVHSLLCPGAVWHCCRRPHSLLSFNTPNNPIARPLSVPTEQ